MAEEDGVAAVEEGCKRDCWCRPSSLTVGVHVRVLVESAEAHSLTSAPCVPHKNRTPRMRGAFGTGSEDEEEEEGGGGEEERGEEEGRL